MKAVIDIHPNLKYRSDLGQQLRFLSKSHNLAVARSCLRDWIIYRETKRGGGHGRYFAVAFATELQPDPFAPGQSILFVDSFLRFPTAVDLKIDGRYAETQLLVARRPLQIGVMLQGKTIRQLYGSDFDRIVRMGFAGAADGQVPDESFDPKVSGFLEQSDGSSTDWQPRRLETTLQTRTFRDRIFRTLILRAYNDTCAITNTFNTDGRGHVEAQAIHLWPVAAGGPDIEQNGFAAGGTAHWFVDNYLIILNADYTVRIAPGLMDPRHLALLPPEGQPIRLPVDTRLWPHTEFMNHHRAEYEKRHG